MRISNSLLVDHRSLSAVDLPMLHGDNWLMVAPGASSTCSVGSSSSCTSTAAIARSAST